MTNKKFILNADDFGLSSAHNRAIIEGYKNGLLKSASLVPNGEAFEEAVVKIIPNCPELGVGIHLNIMEGKSLCNNLDLLTDSNNSFNNSYIQLLLKSFKNNPVIMEQIEKEFRAQIEKTLKRTTVTHIDSHVHIHSIPKIFKLVCSLAKEYGIKQIRTQYETPYIIPDIYRHLNIKYPTNIIKLLLLNTLTLFNEQTVHKYGLNTNDYLIGVTYTSMMNSLAISVGISAIKLDKVVVEAIIHPCRYDDGTIDSHFEEFQITSNMKLKKRIESLGFDITNYRDNVL